MGLITTTAETVRPAAEQRVWVRPWWNAEWVRSPYLYVCEVKWTANPTVASAELEWRYGEIQQAGRTFFAEYLPASLIDWYVLIEIAQEYDAAGVVQTWKRWYGVIVDNGDNPQGARCVPDESNPGYARRIATGQNCILAYGLEHLLDRQPITTAWFQRAGDQAELELGRALVFNEDLRAALSGGVDSKKHLANVGNMSLTGQRNAYLFTGDAQSAQPWNPGAIVTYLLAYHAPTNEIGEIAVPFAVHPAAESLLPIWGNPTVRMEGRTVKDILDELLDRRRLMGYTVEVEPNATQTKERVLIRPFTYADEQIQLTSTGAYVAANPSRIALDFDTAIDVESVHLKDSSINLCDQVVARGARIVCCGTISYADGTMIGHWTAAQETAYEAGASGVAGYATWDVQKKEERNAVARAVESLKQVWSYFGLPLEWQGLVADGIATADSWHYLFPYWNLGFDDSPSGASSLPPAWYLPDMRFIPRLPLKTHHDYGLTKIADEAIADTTPAGQKWEYRDPYVLIFLPDTNLSGILETRTSDTVAVLRVSNHGLIVGDLVAVSWTAGGGGSRIDVEVMALGAPGYFGVANGTGDIWPAQDTAIEIDQPRWAEIDKLGAAAGIETLGVGDGRNISCSVSVQDAAPGLVLKAHGTYGQHSLAGSEFTPLAVDYYEAAWDWKTIMATIAMEADRCVEVKYPAELVAECDVARILRINAGDRAALHYVAPGTVVALQNGVPVRVTYPGGFIRDDRDLLNDLAQVAYEWFGVLRQALTLTYRQAYQVVAIGDLITTIGSGATLQTLRTVVTEIRVAMSDRADSPHRTTIQTQWAELDVLRLL
jgi:hypothetical protein